MAPTVDDVAGAGAHARCGEHLLALMVSLTCFRRLGYFPRRADVPVEVVEHLRRCLGLGGGDARAL